MGKYDFDRIIDRRGTGAKKYDNLMETRGRDDLLPFWIADMDFASADCIIDAMKQRLEHPVFGYHRTPDDYYTTIASWIRNLHGWEVNPENIIFIPGIVKGICHVLETFTVPGDKVVLMTPVYHEFRLVVEQHGLIPVEAPMIPCFEDGKLSGYQIDFDCLEKKISEEDVKFLIMANPQNPAGICWSCDTLKRVASIAYEKGIKVIDDEIFAEMALPGYKHTPFQSVSEEARKVAITFMAPSKTFNLSGIITSYCIINNPEIREKFFTYIINDEIDHPNIFQTESTMAAYTKGNQWRQEMLEYVSGNIDYLCSFLEKNIPQIHPLRPQAGFLVWLDCNGLGLEQDELVKLFEEKAHLAINDGLTYGTGGKGFVRFNVGCPRSLLEKALNQLNEAV